MKIDNKLVIAIAVFAVIITAATLSSQAEDSYSAKTAAGWNETQVLSVKNDVVESTIFKPLYIHTSAKKDFIITVSAITSIVTDTRLKGEFGETDSVIIEIEPKVINTNTGELATVHPAKVTFASRIQKIEGKLYETQLICELNDGVPSNCYYEEDPQWLNLTLATANANAFSFISENVGAGDYEITVNATINASSWAASNTGDVPQPLPDQIAGIIGYRTLVVDEVHLAQAYADGDMEL